VAQVVGWLQICTMCLEYSYSYIGRSYAALFNNNSHLCLFSRQSF